MNMIANVLVTAILLLNADGNAKRDIPPDHEKMRGPWEPVELEQGGETATSDLVSDTQHKQSADDDGWHEATKRIPAVDFLMGQVLLACHDRGIKPKEIQELFGAPSTSHEGDMGIDWRNPEGRFIYWEFERYNVWVRWIGGRPWGRGIGTAERVWGRITPG